MFQELSLLNEYFDQPYSVIYEEDLVEKYGRENVSKAIHSGALQHRWVPCGSGKRRCVCWVDGKID